MVYARAGKYYRLTKPIINAVGGLLAREGELIYVKRDGRTAIWGDYLTIATIRYPELYLQGYRSKRWGVGRDGLEHINQAKAKLEWAALKL